jgi:plasmid stabilization system protein ParE
VTEPLDLHITPRAARDIVVAERWWIQNRTKAPEAFSQDLAKAFDLIVVQPGIGGPVQSTRVSGVRRVYLGRTGHYLYYRVSAPPRCIEVLALWHARRGRAPRL